MRMIAEKIIGNFRLTQEDGLMLFEKADLALLGLLAGIVRRKFNENYAYFKVSGDTEAFFSSCYDRTNKNGASRMHVY